MVFQLGSQSRLTSLDGCKCSSLRAPGSLLAAPRPFGHSRQRMPAVRAQAGGVLMLKRVKPICTARAKF